LKFFHQEFKAKNVEKYYLKFCFDNQEEWSSLINDKIQFNYEDDAQMPLTNPILKIFLCDESQNTLAVYDMDLDYFFDNQY